MPHPDHIILLQPTNQMLHRKLAGLISYSINTIIDPQCDIESCNLLFVGVRSLKHVQQLDVSCCNQKAELHSASDTGQACSGILHRLDQRGSQSERFWFIFYICPWFCLCADWCKWYLYLRKLYSFIIQPLVNTGFSGFLYKQKKEHLNKEVVLDLCLLIKFSILIMSPPVNCLRHNAANSSFRGMSIRLRF